MNIMGSRFTENYQSTLPTPLLVGQMWGVIIRWWEEEAAGRLSRPISLYKILVQRFNLNQKMYKNQLFRYQTGFDPKLSQHSARMWCGPKAATLACTNQPTVSGWLNDTHPGPCNEMFCLALFCSEYFAWPLFILLKKITYQLICW